VGKTFTWLKAIFIAEIVILGITTVLASVALTAYNHYQSVGTDSSYESYSSAVDSEQSFAILTIIPLIIGFITLIIWTRKAYEISSRAPVFQSDRKYSKGWTVGAWFIPVGNLFIPKRVISEIDHILTPTSDLVDATVRWQDRKNDYNGTIWWGLFIVANICDRMALSISDQTDPDGFLTATAYTQSTIIGIVSNLLTIMSLYFGLKYLGRITKNALSMSDRIVQ
jgi:hypothetical protein